MGIFREIFSWWSGNTWGTRLLIWRQGRFVGRDEFGNIYYEQKESKRDPQRPLRRWVTYKDLSEPSQIPPSWHAWLQFTTDEVPKQSNYSPRPWEKKHQMNQTGGPGAYRPLGSILRYNKKSSKTIRGYDPWRPN
ncbi:MAG: NADH:ubiquinone oxidoreductase subunit NDUFA12 [Hyphomicrobium sp.]